MFDGLALGKSQHLDADQILQDELDENLLDTVSVAGDRFSRMMKVLPEGLRQRRLTKIFLSLKNRALSANPEVVYDAPIIT